MARWTSSVKEIGVCSNRVSERPVRSQRGRLVDTTACLTGYGPETAPFERVCVQATDGVELR